MNCEFAARTLVGQLQVGCIRLEFLKSQLRYLDSPDSVITDIDMGLRPTCTGSLQYLPRMISSCKYLFEWGFGHPGAVANATSALSRQS